MIQLDEDVAELGICHRGRLLLDYRPGGNTNADNVADVVAQHLSRLQRYLERYHSYLDVAADSTFTWPATPRPSPAHGRNLPSCRSSKSHVLEPGDLDMPWQHADGPPGTDLAAALGTAMALYPESDRTARAKPDRQHAGPTARADAADPDSQLDAGRRGAPDCRDAARAAPESAARNERLARELEDLAPACVRATELRLKLLAAETKLQQLQALEKAAAHNRTGSRSSAASAKACRTTSGSIA